MTGGKTKKTGEGGSLLPALASFVRFVDAVSDRVGRIVSWLTLGVVLVCFAVVVLRYAFSVGFVWMQDLYVWLHAAAFTIGASYALRHERSEEHTSELQSLMRISYAVFCLKKKITTTPPNHNSQQPTLYNIHK